MSDFVAASCIFSKIKILDFVAASCICSDIKIPDCRVACYDCPYIKVPSFVQGLKLTFLLLAKNCECHDFQLAKCKLLLAK